jgi:hypothetical protein
MIRIPKLRKANQPGRPRHALTVGKKTFAFRLKYLAFSHYCCAPGLKWHGDWPWGGRKELRERRWRNSVSGMS